MVYRVIILAAMLINAAPDLAAQARVKYLMHSGYAGRIESPADVDRSALRDARRLARLGDVNAQFNAAAMYHALGQVDSALYWYRRAALFRHPLAAYNLGLLHYEGQFIPRDLDEARRWLLVAGEAGYPPAQTHLAQMAYRDELSESGPAAEFDWYRKAAMQGEPVAQFNLGILYWKGYGVERDPVRAYAWVSLAAPALEDGQARQTMASALSDAEREAGLSLAERLEEEIRPFVMR